MESNVPRAAAQAFFADFATSLREIIRVRLTCDICGATDGSHDEVVHAGYAAMEWEVIEEELADIRSGNATLLSAEEVFGKDSGLDIDALMEEIKEDNEKMPLGKLLAEIMDMLAGGFIVYYERRKVHVRGRRNRRTVVFVCCPVCTASMERDAYEQGDRRLEHEPYCIVSQARVFTLRLLKTLAAPLDNASAM